VKTGNELKKQLGLIEVFAIASGAMISSGLFVLPAIAYAKAGPAVIFSYLLASILIIPSLLCQAELASAMPRAGGMYLYVERSLGTIPGLFTGLADWFSLALKSAFAIVGIAIFIEFIVLYLFGTGLTSWQLKAVSVISCLFFAGLNITSVKHTSKFQVLLVISLLLILTAFVLLGTGKIDIVRYQGFFDKGWLQILATSGLIFVSFGGLNKVVNVAEEVRNPSKNIPLGMLLAWFIVSVFYIAVVAVTVGTVDGAQLSVNLMPISLAASKFIPFVGFGLLGIAAFAAFTSTANAGILTASRSPMAMSRDTLLPSVFCKISKKFKTPYISIMLTTGFMVIAIVFLDVETLAKTASTLLIVLYILGNISLVVMRESKIQSYRPEFKSPLHSSVHFFIIIVYALLIIDMGKMPLLTGVVFISLSIAWYYLYTPRQANRASAIMHIVERVTDKELSTITLEDELRDILLERDEVTEDRFDRLIKQCEILDIKQAEPADKIFRKASEILSSRLDINESIVFEKFKQRETEGSTVIEPGLAIPHIVVEGEKKFDMLLVRASEGINFPNVQQPVRIMFILAGSKDERNYHLRALMAIAQITREKGFAERWLEARNTASIRNLLLLSRRKRDK
jgi:amino acid transporter/mannitol/fructose-specific phosphotransferase system IIA component (Ntr-type)